MKRPVRLAIAAAGFWLGLVSPPATAAFSAVYVFGDGVCTTTNNTEPSTAYLYYGHRFSNGRVWVEVLAQRQGLTLETNRNWSYFGHYSAHLLTNAARFAAPPNASNALFAIWVNDADFVWNLNHIDPPYTTNSSLPQWTNAIRLSLTNHLQAIQTLYAKGARTLVMPNAVDVSKVPYYSLSPADNTFVRQRVIDFNNGFATVLNQARATLPGLVIYSPDYFALLDSMLANPAAYGMVYPGVDAVDDPALADKSLNGPGAYYVFWDYQDPSAKAHEIMADLAQQLIAPVRIGTITSSPGTNVLDVSNLAIGLNGFVDRSTNFTSWSQALSITSSNAAQTLFIPASGPRQFYRLRFPLVWSWP